jgi:hypothetical protein
MKQHLQLLRCLLRYVTCRPASLWHVTGTLHLVTQITRIHVTVAVNHN